MMQARIVSEGAGVHVKRGRGRRRPTIARHDTQIKLVAQLSHQNRALFQLRPYGVILAGGIREALMWRSTPAHCVG